MRLFRYPPSRRTYWSCSSLAQKAFSRLGIAKPRAATLEQWKAWKTQSKARHPLFFWFLEEGLDRLQDIWCFPSDVLEAIRGEWRNRFSKPTHLLKTGLPAGPYYSVETRILHALFQTLVDQVTEQADREERTSLARSSDEKVRAYLDWAGGLDDPSLPEGQQSPAFARAARELKALYIWWTVERPGRPDPWETFKPESEEDSDDFLTEVDQETRDRWRAQEEMRAQQEAEDTEMLIRLIRIRNILES